MLREIGILFFLGNGFLTSENVYSGYCVHGELQEKKFLKCGDFTETRTWMDTHLHYEQCSKGSGC